MVALQSTDILHSSCLRWDLFTSQFSEPVYLEEGRPYYFELISNQFPGPWDIGLGVKLHDSTLTGGQYDSDYEEQRIAISSTVVQEQHVSLLIQVMDLLLCPS